MPDGPQKVAVPRVKAAPPDFSKQPQLERTPTRESGEARPGRLPFSLEALPIFPPDPPSEERELAARVRAHSGHGQPLGGEIQSRLEHGTGARLSNIRIHTDAEADQLANSVQAAAFTTGRDIFFRQGLYRPTSTPGLRLLAHEVTHTLQQSVIPPAPVSGPGGLAISRAGGRQEQQAGAVAEQIARGRSARRLIPHARGRAELPTPAASTSSSLLLQRQELLDVTHSIDNKPVQYVRVDVPGDGSCLFHSVLIGKIARDMYNDLIRENRRGSTPFDIKRLVEEQAAQILNVERRNLWAALQEQAVAERYAVRQWWDVHMDQARKELRADIRSLVFHYLGRLGLTENNIFDPQAQALGGGKDWLASVKSATQNRAPAPGKGEDQPAQKQMNQSSSEKSGSLTTEKIAPAKNEKKTDLPLSEPSLLQSPSASHKPAALSASELELPERLKKNFKPYTPPPHSSSFWTKFQDLSNPDSGPQSDVEMDEEEASSMSEGGEKASSESQDLSSQSDDDTGEEKEEAPSESQDIDTQIQEMGYLVDYFGLLVRKLGKVAQTETAEDQITDAIESIFNQHIGQQVPLHGNLDILLRNMLLSILDRNIVQRGNAHFRFKGTDLQDADITDTILTAYKDAFAVSDIWAGEAALLALRQHHGLNIQAHLFDNRSRQRVQGQEDPNNPINIFEETGVGHFQVLIGPFDKDFLTPHLPLRADTDASDWHGETGEEYVYPKELITKLSESLPVPPNILGITSLQLILDETDKLAIVDQRHRDVYDRVENALSGSPFFDDEDQESDESSKRSGESSRRNGLSELQDALGQGVGAFLKEPEEDVSMEEPERESPLSPYACTLSLEEAKFFFSDFVKQFSKWATVSSKQLPQPIKVNAGLTDVEVLYPLRDEDGEVVLYTDATHRLVDQLQDVLGGPLSRGYTRTGFHLVQELLAEVVRVQTQMSDQERGKGEQDLGQIEKGLVELRQALRINSLLRATRCLPMPRTTVPFPVFWPGLGDKGKFLQDTPFSKENYIQEVKRQVEIQEHYLNGIPLDEWIVGLDLFNLKHQERRPDILSRRSPSYKQSLIDELRRRTIGVDESIKRRSQKQQRVFLMHGAHFQNQPRSLQPINAFEAITEQAQEQADLKHHKRPGPEREIDPKRVDEELGAMLETEIPKARDPQKTNAISADMVGRANPQQKWKEEHRQALIAVKKRFSKQWEGLIPQDDLDDSLKGLHILHNPDQVAGGERELPRKPEDLADFLGPGIVNSAIGGTWGVPEKEKKQSLMQMLFSHMLNLYPEASWPLYKTNFNLQWKVTYGTREFPKAKPSADPPQTPKSNTGPGSAPKPKKVQLDLYGKPVSDELLKKSNKKRKKSKEAPGTNQPPTKKKKK